MNENEDLKLWEAELDRMKSVGFTPKMKEMVNKVDTLIRSGKITYLEFASDLIDAHTEMVLSPFTYENGIAKPQEEQNDDMCTMLMTIYDSKFELEKVTGVPTDTVEVPESEGVSQSESFADASATEVVESN